MGEIIGFLRHQIARNSAQGLACRADLGRYRVAFSIEARQAELDRETVERLRGLIDDGPDAA